MCLSEPCHSCSSQVYPPAASGPAQGCTRAPVLPVSAVPVSHRCHTRRPSRRAPGMQLHPKMDPVHGRTPRHLPCPRLRQSPSPACAACLTQVPTRRPSRRAPGTEPDPEIDPEPEMASPEKPPLLEAVLASCRLAAPAGSDAGGSAALLAEPAAPSSCCCCCCCCCWGRALGPSFSPPRGAGLGAGALRQRKCVKLCALDHDDLQLGARARPAGQLGRSLEVHDGRCAVGCSSPDQLGAERSSVR